MNELLINLDSRNMLLQELQQTKGIKVCSDEEFTYYRVYAVGCFLMYRQRTLRPDGRKSYYLTDTFAQVLGFRSVNRMSYHLTGIQYWRRFISVHRLKLAFDRYNGLR